MTTYYELRAQLPDGSSVYGLFDIHFNGPQPSATAVVTPQTSPEDLATVVIAAIQARGSYPPTPLPSDPTVIVAAFKGQPKEGHYITHQKPPTLPEIVNFEGQEVKLFELNSKELDRSTAVMKALLE